MVITCPSCSTRYRRPEGTGESVFQCSCSRCDAVFSSEQGTAPAGPAPVLAVQASLQSEGKALPGGRDVTLADFPIGMDDPTLETKIRPAVPSKPVDPGEPEVEVPDFGLPEDPDAMFEAAVAGCEPEASPEPEAVEKHSPRDPAPRPGFLAYLVVLLLPAGLAAGAWQLSLTLGEDPMIWTTPAGVLGLLFSWLWVRWKYRAR